MIITVIKELAEDSFIFETEANSIKDILNYLKYLKSSEYVKEIVENEYAFVLSNVENQDKSVSLPKEMILTTIESYNLLIIVKKVSGELPVIPILIAVGSAMGASAAFGAIMTAGVIYTSATLTIVSSFATAMAYAAYAAITIVGTLASFMVSQAIAPTPVFQGDPVVGTSFNSNLFGQAKMTVAQGGCIPLIYGETFCSGTLICSSITTVQG